MNFWFLIVALAVGYLGQVWLSIYQMKDFANNYGMMRRRGKVAIGKRKNAFSAGSIALFLVDDTGRIQQGRAISGLTVLARFKPLDHFDGLIIDRVDEGPLHKLPKGLRLAVLNAQYNWLAVQRDEIPQDPPGPFTRLLARLRGAKEATLRVRSTSRTPRTEGVTS